MLVPTPHGPSQYATQALLRDKVDVIHGGITSSSREVMRPIVQRFNGLLFYNSLYEGGVCDRRHANTGMVPAHQLEVLIPYVMNELGDKKAYILAADYNYGHITAKWMQKIIKENGGEVLGVEFIPLDVSNFAPMLARIQEANPDVVYSALVSNLLQGLYCIKRHSLTNVPLTEEQKQKWLYVCNDAWSP